MLKIINYLLGYYQITCKICGKEFYLEKKKIREGIICCSFGCMMEAERNIK